MPFVVGRHGEAPDALRQAGTVVALEEIPLLDYLAAGADETARRLVRRASRRSATRWPRPWSSTRTAT
jgi:hypothetical protein